MFYSLQFGWASLLSADNLGRRADLESTKDAAKFICLENRLHANDDHPQCVANPQMKVQPAELGSCL